MQARQQITCAGAGFPDPSPCLLAIIRAGGANARPGPPPTLRFSCQEAQRTQRADAKLGRLETLWPLRVMVLAEWHVLATVSETWYYLMVTVTVGAAFALNTS